MRNIILTILVLCSSIGAVIKHMDWPTYFHDIIKLDTLPPTTTEYEVLVRDTSDSLIKVYPFSLITDSSLWADSAGWAQIAEYADSAGVCWRADTVINLPDSIFCDYLQVGDTTDSYNRVLRVLSDQNHSAGIEAYGVGAAGNGLGYLFVGENSNAGGGVFFNGNGTPPFATGELDDQVMFYRRSGGVNYVVFYYSGISNIVRFNADIHLNTANVTGSESATSDSTLVPLMQLVDSIGTKADTIHATTHYPDSSDELYDQMLNTTDTVQFAFENIIGVNEASLRLYDTIAKYNLCPDFSQLNIINSAASSITLMSETDGQQSENIYLSSVDTTNKTVKTWALMHTGAGIGNAFALLYGESSGTPVPFSNIDSVFMVDTFGLARSDNMKVRSGNFGGSDVATADSQCVPKMQLDDSLDQKWPMVESFKWPKSEAVSSRGYLITTNIDEDTTINVRLSMRCWSSTSSFNAEITIICQGPSNPTFPNSNAIITDYVGGGFSGSSGGIDSILVYDELDGLVRIWIEPMQLSQEAEFEIYSRDYRAEITNITDASYSVPPGGVNLIPQKQVVVTDEDNEQYHIPYYVVPGGNISSFAYAYFSSISTVFGATSATSYCLIDTSKYELWFESELKSKTDKDSVWHTGDIVAGDMLRQGATWHAFGGFHDSSVTISISASDTWYQVTNGDGTLFAGDEADGISISGDTMTFANSGDYIGSLSITLSGVAGQDYSFRIYNVTQASQMGYDIGQTTTGAGNQVNVAFPLYIEATASDEIVLQVSNESGTQDPVLKSAVFTISYLHD